MDLGSRLIIGISGKKGVGKDFVTKILQEKMENIGAEVATYSFSDPVREFAQNNMIAEFGISFETARRLCNDPACKDTYSHLIGSVPRDYICNAADMMKKVNPTCFTDIWTNWASVCKADVIINSSVRTDKEADIITSMGGTRLHVIGNESLRNPAGDHHTESDTHDLQLCEIIMNERKDASPSLDLVLEKIAEELALPFGFGASPEGPGHA